jgi:hypothetical protein
VTNASRESRVRDVDLPLSPVESLHAYLEGRIALTITAANHKNAPVRIVAVEAWGRTAEAYSVERRLEALAARLHLNVPERAEAE